MSPNPSNIHHTRAHDIGELQVPDPEYGDFRLSVFPFLHDGRTPIILPWGFYIWERTLRNIMRHVPVQADATQCFVTIDTKFFAEAGTLRREGVHMDGNFCADPDWSPKATWGGGGGTWAGIVALSREAKPDNSHVRMGFASPYDIMVPVGQYMSGALGGTLVASSYSGCLVWPGTYVGEVGEGGDWGAMIHQLKGVKRIEAHRLWFMSSNCPHETLPIPQGARRTLIRVTLPHNYRNAAIVPPEGQ